MGAVKFISAVMFHFWVILGHCFGIFSDDFPSRLFFLGLFVGAQWPFVSFIRFA